MPPSWISYSHLYRLLKKTHESYTKIISYDEDEAKSDVNKKEDSEMNNSEIKFFKYNEFLLY